jgi:hypothetical protein
MADAECCVLRNIPSQNRRNSIGGFGRAISGHDATFPRVAKPATARHRPPPPAAAHRARREAADAPAPAAQPRGAMLNVAYYATFRPRIAEIPVVDLTEQT